MSEKEVNPILEKPVFLLFDNRSKIMGYSSMNHIITGLLTCFLVFQC